MITIVDYNAGNLTSVKRAFDYLGIPCAITPDPDAIRKAERIVFPGVGHAASAIAFLTQRGIDAALRETFEKGTPILGICLGCQIILTFSEEGNTRCIDLIPGTVRRFKLSDPALKIPHMGWNQITISKPHKLLSEVKTGDAFYFVHSYYPAPDDAACTFATTDYETIFPVAIGRGNLFATQFHPEKSGRIGLTMLKRFSEWDGNHAE
jgi:glutamine amidotransferase